MRCTTRTLFYGDDDGDGADDGGLDIPDTKTPDYWDFAYFSFTLGMTFQTSDTQITGATMRRVALGHSMLAFVFNIGRAGVHDQRAGWRGLGRYKGLDG